MVRSIKFNQAMMGLKVVSNQVNGPPQVANFLPKKHGKSRSFGDFVGSVFNILGWANLSGKLPMVTIHHKSETSVPNTRFLK